MSDERIGIPAWPLYWPEGWARTKSPTFSRFGGGKARTLTVWSTTQNVLRECELLGAGNVVISTNLQLRNDGLPYSNQKRPTDCGVAVWFDLAGDQRVLACDKWDGVESNLRAIAKHIEALRGQDRWGVGTLDQAFRGYQALPATAGGEPWWKVLAIEPGASEDAINRAFKAKAHVHHPDRGGDRAEWDRLCDARHQALAVGR